MRTPKICFTCKHWTITKWCELNQKKRYWNSKCLKWTNNSTKDIKKEIIVYLDKNPLKYENYDHQLDSTRLLKTRALNCTDGHHTDDEKEYRKKFIKKLMEEDTR